jgi:hypothetical protein
MTAAEFGHLDEDDWGSLMASDPGAPIGLVLSDRGHRLSLAKDGSPEPPQPAPSLAELYEPINWHQLWSATTSEPDWLCPDIHERGRLHAIYAPRKYKKSLFTLLLVAELITARSLLGGPNPHREPLRVLYIDIENAKDDIRQRLQDAGYGPDDLTNLTYLSFPSLPALDSPVGGQHLLALVEYHRPDLLVLDTTSRVVAAKKTTQTPSAPCTATPWPPSKPSAPRSYVWITPARTLPLGNAAAQPKATTSIPHGSSPCPPRIG